MGSVLDSNGFIGSKSLPSAETRQRGRPRMKARPNTSQEGKERATHACISDGILGRGMSRHQPSITNNGSSDGRGGSERSKKQKESRKREEGEKKKKRRRRREDLA